MADRRRNVQMFWKRCRPVAIETSVNFEPRGLTTEAKIIGVYRRRNARLVLDLLEPALEQGWTTAWWALDGIEGSLERYTVGEGPGEKFPLVNETLRLSGSPVSWTLVSDDDLSFRQGDMTRLVRLCDSARFDIAQPARARDSAHNFRITAAARLARARLTTFVESGPLFVVGPRFRDLVLPLPKALGMGWGVELEWFDLMEKGCRLGIVDSVVIEHLGTATEYDTTQLHARLRAELAARGATSFRPFQNTLAAWRPWQRRPAWVDHGQDAAHTS